MNLPHFILRSALAGALALATCAPAAATPFVPADDALILERLPARNTPQFRYLCMLRERAAAMPTDIVAATALANAYYQAARSEGDPRFLGYAEAALAPWWKDAEPPTDVLVLLRAKIRQNNHDFARALIDLDQAIARDPREARAWLESLLGEIAHRRAAPNTEQHFRAALAADPRDLCTLAAYNDWLLDVSRESSREAEVIALLQDAARVDGLLLREGLIKCIAFILRRYWGICYVVLLVR